MGWFWPWPFGMDGLLLPTPHQFNLQLGLKLSLGFPMDLTGRFDYSACSILFVAV
jgi:hypothetical protein